MLILSLWGQYQLIQLTIIICIHDSIKVKIGHWHWNRISFSRHSRSLIGISSTLYQQCDLIGQAWSTNENGVLFYHFGHWPPGLPTNLQGLENTDNFHRIPGIWIWEVELSENKNKLNSSLVAIANKTWMVFFYSLTSYEPQSLVHTHFLYDISWRMLSRSSFGIFWHLDKLVIDFSLPKQWSITQNWNIENNQGSIPWKVGTLA